MPIFLYLTYSNSQSFDFSVRSRRFFSIAKSNKNGMGDSKKNRDGSFLFAIPEVPAEVVDLSKENVDEIILSHFEVSLELTRRILVLNDISEARIQNYLDSVRASRYKPMLEGSPAFALSDKIRSFNGMITLQWTQIQYDSPLAGRSIEESGIRAQTGMSIVGIIHRGRTDANPRPDTVLHAGDLVAAIGNEEQATAFARLTHSPLAGSPESATTMAIPI